MTIDLSNGEHPAIIEVFTDSESLMHVGWGVLAGLVNVPYSTAMVTLFTGYQVTQAQSGEPWERTGGEFIELAIGLILAGLIKRHK